VREFITKAIKELQEAQAMRGERRPACPTSSAAAPDAGGQLRVCVNIPGLNRAASQDAFWPSRAGWGRGVAADYIRSGRHLPALRAAGVGIPGGLGPTRASRASGAARPLRRGPSRRASPTTSTLLQQHYQVTLWFVQLRVPRGLHHPQAA
jgi:hypothetical protein